MLKMAAAGEGGDLELRPFDAGLLVSLKNEDEEILMTRSSGMKTVNNHKGGSFNNKKN